MILSLVFLYGAASGILSGERDAPRWLSWPMPIWNRIAHDWRRPKPVLPRPNYIRIAVLEHDLCGMQPDPGTGAALAVGVRSAGHCLNHQPIATLTFDAPTSSGTCAGCGRAMVLNDAGNWELA
ncbi:hypothetical protein [Streptomyces sp. NPDC006739]|uniref:hypothetical protein n=1 Tax=Streptomyces sp. NPDC006739 TaxID=3364763 RepID=UPI003683F02C